MAAVLIGGAFLSATLQVAFDRLTSHQITNYFCSRKLKDGLLKKLHFTLISINQVLEDAEEMQYRNTNVKQWLDELKHAVYEADDLLDEIATEAEKHKLEADIQTSGTKVKNFFTSFANLFDKGIESRLKEVLDNLDSLAKQKDVLGLKEGSTTGSVVVFGGKKRLPTTSFVDESSMYGRDGDKEKLVNFLLSGDVCTKQPHVISIVGMGGMGKTSLAQLVYNDKRMEDQFELKAWVCVSEDFDVVRVTKLILEALQCLTGDTKDLNLLQHQMKERLMGKKFLLVLDDVWNENRKSWEVLQVPFTFNSTSNKILVTTRSDKVALVMQSTQTHHLEPLEEEDCWKLFTREAFKDQDAGAYANLESVGRKIVEKCKGLPLAIKTLGSLLQTKLSHQEWIKILESDLWELSENDSDIIPALRLSYHYLPSNLKQCFAYCSIFPKDYEINKDVTIKLWMAEGLLQSCQANKCAEELGNEYFNELESRSFFQQSSRQVDHFIMHDLLNDLAKLVSGEFCFRLEGDMVNIPIKVRHFSYLPKIYDNLETFKPLIKCHQLRSFIPNSWNLYPIHYINMNLIHDLLSRFKYLRVLSLSGYVNLFELGDDITNLKHLRSLDLSLTYIRKLPNSIGRLHNLQTLKLNGCWCLTELPSDLHKLINLHHLEFHESGIRKLSLNIGRLNHLRTLTSFFVSKHSGCSIKGIGKLKHLQGRLSILELENVTDPMDAMEARMKDKMNLDELELGWNKDNEDSEFDRGVLDALQPHNNLKKLTITSYGGTRYPDWLGPHYLLNLASLELRGSKYCWNLPPLGQLPYLKELCILGFDAIVVIGNEFYGDISSNLPFRRLEILNFEGMREWEEWVSCDYVNKVEYFPCLQKLRISDCPKLRKALPHCLPSIKGLVIEDCQLLEASLPKAAALEELELREDKDIRGSGSNGSFLDQLVSSNAYIEELGFTNSFRRLQIRGRHLNRPFSLELFPNLPSLALTHCPKLVTFPEGGTFAPKLEDLYLCKLSNLKSLPENIYSQIIRECRDINGSCGNGSFLDQLVFTEAYIEELGFANSLRRLWIKGGHHSVMPFSLGLFPNLQSLFLFNFPNLYAFPISTSTYPYFISLTHLYFSECPKLVSFPVGGLYAPKLEYMWLQGLTSLKSLPENMHTLLPSLKYLALINCQELELLPLGGFPLSLTRFVISFCSKLFASRKEWGLQNLHSLTCFRISHDFENVESFPEESLLPPNITKLNLWNCSKLKSINHKGFLHLRSLQFLWIDNCPVLQCLPKEGLPKTLSSLEIKGSPLLEVRCQREKGQDWHKISHIPHILIGDTLMT